MGIFYTNYNQIIICKALVSCIFSYGAGANVRKQYPPPVICSYEAESPGGTCKPYQDILTPVLMMISRTSELTLQKFQVACRKNKNTDSYT
jgi:hypothetical protein